MVAFLPGSAPAQQPAQAVSVIAHGHGYVVRYTAEFPPDAFVFGRQRDFDTVALMDGGVRGAPGQPMLPTQTVRIALPADMLVTGLRVVDTQATVLPNEYTLFPAQPPKKMDVPLPDDFVQPDDVAYASSAAVPAEVAEFGQEQDLAGQPMALVTFCPVQYVPATRRLTLLTAITIELDGIRGYTCGDYLPAQATGDTRALLQQEAEGMVVNPQQVALQVQPGAPHRLGVAAGRYDYVIVTQDTWVFYFQLLADWKTKKGVPAIVVTTTWIYNSGGYSGTNVEKIRAFVQDAYNTWGAVYFLLGGDVGVVPPAVTTYSSVDSQSIPNDTYYGDFDDDWVCEVHIGRASVGSTSDIATFINKVLTYEKNPPTTDYAKTAFFMGFDLDSSTPSEQMKASIKTNYLPSSWTYRKVYDSDTGTHLTNAIAALNAGNHLANHSDHSSTTVMGCGYVNHNALFSASAMLSLTNGSRQTILYSLGCWACDYNAPACIAEAFVRNSNGGGIAFIGNSRYGWYQPGATDYYSARYDRYFFRSLFTRGYHKLGPCFSDHKTQAYQNDDTYKYIFTELTLLGDPELNLWTADPVALSHTHAATLNMVVANNFPVTVTSGSSPVSGATVCLWKDGDIYQIATTNSSGIASFTVTPSAIGTLYVTSRKENYIPHESTATVTSLAYALTVNVSGSGSVDLNPPGGAYGPGVTVQLQANADDGWHFDHWSGNLTGSTNPTSLLIDGNKTVTATFVQDQVYYTLTANAQGPGHVDLNPPGGSYTSGSTVQLTAVTDADARFDHWTGALSGSTNPTSVLMDGNKTVTAVFWLRGDMNCDGVINNQDIDPFVLALFNPAGYAQQYSNCNVLNGDMTADSVVNNQDIDGFVGALFGG